MYRPKLGSILMFEGDERQFIASIVNVDAFTAVDHKLAQGENDVTSTYITSSPDKEGNVLTSAIIGDKASLPAGTYRYFLDGTYGGGKKRSWYVDVRVEPKDNDLWFARDEVWDKDYNPELDEVTIYEGNTTVLSKAFTDNVVLESVTGAMKEGSDDTVEATYNSGSATVSGSTVTSGTIGGLASLPAGEYIYYVTVSWLNQKATFFWRIIVLPKYGTA